MQIVGLLCIITKEGFAIVEIQSHVRYVRLRLQAVEGYSGSKLL